MVLVWWCPTKQNHISELSVFPLVYVQVRQWGAGNYNHIIPMPKDICFYCLPLPIQLSLEHVNMNFVVMMAILVIVTTTKTHLV